MKMKKYRAASMPEVMKKVRAELGAQAVILQSKTVYSGGMLGLFKKKQIEVVAAVDPNAGQAELPERETVSSRQPAVTPVPVDLKDDMTEMKKMIQKLQLAASAHPVYPEAMQPVMNQLKRQGICNELLDRTAEHLLEKWNSEKGDVTDGSMQEWARAFVKSCLSFVEAPRPAASLFYLLGPTGVGKTTTLAKLASKEVLEKNKKVAFVTTDTYRIAAIEQLKTYAGLLNAPMKVAYSEADMQAALQTFHSYDVVYIDTAGRNYRDKQYVQDLKPFLQGQQEQAVYYLVLSAAAKEEDLHEIVENFSGVPLNGFIFTKIDETKTKGLLINLMYTYKIGTSYVTNGQNVPDDLIEASVDRLVDTLFEDEVK